jgi:serine/threonine protein kinase
MNSELLLFHAQVVKCIRPEDLFGIFTGDTNTQLGQLKSLYRKFAMIAHVDRYKQVDEQRIAHIAFTQLNTLHQEAINKINSKIYGTTKQDTAPIVLKSKKRTYTITSVLAGGDLSAVYLGTTDESKPVVIKIAKNPVFNDLLSVEATTLAALNLAAAFTVSYKKFIPVLLDTFQTKVLPSNEIRIVNIFEEKEGLRLLTEVASQYPEGIDQQHFVWIYNRLLTILSFPHSQGIIHGAVLPTNVLIHPIDHSIQLIDWCFSCRTNYHVVALSTGYKSFYPPEILSKGKATPASDIYMAAMCMCYLLGFDFGEGLSSSKSNSKVHPKFRRLLESCLIKNPARRPQSAWGLYKELGVIAEEIFGKRKYVKLELV